MFEKFAIHLRSLGYSQNTSNSYLSDLKNCESRKIIDKSLSFFDSHVFFSISISNSTRKHWSASIKKYAKFLKKDNPLKYIELPRVNPKLPTVKSHNQIQNLIKKQKNLEIKIILSILYSTGCRVGSLIGLKVKDIGDNSISFHTAKGNKPYIAMLLPETKIYMSKFLKNRNKEEYLFNHKGKQITSAYIRMKLKRELGNEYINPHSLRHSIATELAERGADIFDIKNFLNHASITTSQKYIHLSTNKQRKKLQGKHPMLSD